MQHDAKFMRYMMERYQYPEIAVREFSRLLDRMEQEPEFGAAFDAIVFSYMFPTVEKNIKDALEKIDALGEQYGVHEDTMEFLFLLACTPILKERYENAGLPEQVFWDTMDDLRCKLLECIKVKGIPGTFVGGWYGGFMRMTRFAFGRFQYEINSFTAPDELHQNFVLKCGKVMRPGDSFINFHIPASGVPLTDEVRFDSYKKAYKFYQHLFPDGLVVFGCASWLLYPRHSEFLPKNSNILKFLGDFEIVSSGEHETFGDAWRVFDDKADLPPAELPRDTSLRKAYADWLTAGNKGGYGFGLFVFDGANIVR